MGAARRDNAVSRLHNQFKFQPIFILIFDDIGTRVEKHTFSIVITSG